jgi:hypothetical protein
LIRSSAVSFLFGNQGFGDLTGEVAVDRGEAGLDPLLGHVAQTHVEARKSTYMRDAAAHLTSADNADFLDFDCHPVKSDRLNNGQPTRGDRPF